MHNAQRARKIEDIQPRPYGDPPLSQQPIIGFLSETTSDPDRRGDVQCAAIEAGYRASSPIGLLLRLVTVIILTLALMQTFLVKTFLVKTWAN
jgi:hypothetical protein